MALRRPTVRSRSAPRFTSVFLVRDMPGRGGETVGKRLNPRFAVIEALSFGPGDHLENLPLLRVRDGARLNVALSGRLLERLVTQRRRHRMVSDPAVHGEGRMKPSHPVRGDLRNTCFAADPLYPLSRPIPPVAPE